MLGLAFLGRTGPVLAGKTVTLRRPKSSDFREWAALRRESRAFLEPWEPSWAHDEFTPAVWRQRMRRYRTDHARGTSETFFVFDNASGRLAGGLTAGNIRRGAAQSGSIGYWMGERYAGRGLMTEALPLVVRHCFETLRLHRLEAACIPDNHRSVRVLEKAGFQREGLLRSYLKINGTWQDHYLYALVADQHPGIPE